MENKDTPTVGAKLIQHIQHMDHMEGEVNRLLPKLPLPAEIGNEQAEKMRFMAAAKHARNFSIQQMQNIIAKSQSYMNFKLAKRHKDDSNQITDWIEEILDATTGYKRAHNWTRPTSKAPPLPTHMWKKGKYYSHPHDMGDRLLQE